MAYLKWFALLIPSYAMAIIGRFFAPILPIFASDDGWLPSWLWWFQTLFDSLDGDENHQERWPGTDALSTYKRRVAWLLRNVAYGFDMRVCGVSVDPDKDVIEIVGNPDISDKNGLSGVCRWYAYGGTGGKLIAWQWYFIWHYEIFGLKKCVRIGAGWKLWSESKLREEPAQYFSYFHPFKTAFN